MTMSEEREIRKNLQDAGCSRDEAESILECIRSGNLRRAEKLIGASRKRQLEQVHKGQLCIDRLDYLCYQMKKRGEMT